MIVSDAPSFGIKTSYDFKNIYAILKKTLLDYNPESFDNSKIKDIKSDLIKHIGRGSVISNEKNIKTAKELIDILNNLLKKFPNRKELKELRSALEKTLPEKKIKEPKNPLQKIFNDTKSTKIEFYGSKNIKNITSDIVKNLLQILKNASTHKELKNHIKILKNHINPPDKTDIKNAIVNSGILYESKIKKHLEKPQTLQKILKNDLKKTLWDMQNIIENKGDEKLLNTVKNTLSSIELLQTSSAVNGTFVSFLPYFDEKISKGSISVDKAKNSDISICKIELFLQDYKELDISLMLQSNNLSINFSTLDKKLENILKKNKNTLIQNLQSLGLRANIFFSDKTKSKYEETHLKSSTMDMCV